MHNEGIVLTSPSIYSMLLALDLEQVGLVEQVLAAVGLVLVHSAVPEEYLVPVAVVEVAAGLDSVDPDNFHSWVLSLFSLFPV